jgi:orotate phosphoribosyltransferase
VIHYRTIGDLSRTIQSNLHRVPSGIDLIVGIPRSGLLAANILALHLNLPLADLDGFLEGRILGVGERFVNYVRRTNLRGACKALIIDDSLHTGKQITAVRNRIKGANVPCEVIFGSIYVTDIGRDMVDLWFEEVPTPRVFEWNVMHHGILKESCVDIDGVLSLDPSDKENDDGSRYHEFLNTVPLRICPTVTIGWLVTNRLEKYRALTKKWLERHGIQYHELVMLDLPSKEARLRAGTHGSFKAGVFKNTAAQLFIESNHCQAMEIARLSGKPVLSVEGNCMVNPSIVAQLSRRARRAPRSLLRRTKKLIDRMFRPYLTNPTFVNYSKPAE